MAKLRFDPIAYQFYCGSRSDGTRAKEAGFMWDPIRGGYYTGDPRVAMALASRGDNYVKRLLADAAAAAAEGYFRQALDWAGRQGALSWELRAATSLGRLLSDQGRSADAAALLQPVYDRFTEGFTTADLRAAKALLDDLP